MNKVYIIIPLVGILIFGGFYKKFESGFEARAAASKAHEEQIKKEKALQEQKNREIAYKAAMEAQAIRKVEREKKEALEQKKKDDRQAAEDKRERAFSDRNKLTTQVRSLKKDLDEVQAEIKKIEDEKKTLLDEQAFLKTYVKQAEANVKYYYDLLDKIALAEKARADAAAAAAAAAKKNS
jgi:colicin import membrane protein